MRLTKLIAISCLIPSAVAIAKDAPKKDIIDESYIGIQLGQSSIDYQGLDDTDSGFKLLAGHRYKNIGIEAAYTELGGTSGYITPYKTFALDASTVSLSAMGYLPVNESFSFFGKLGLNKWSVDGTARTHNQTFSDSSDGTDPVFGLGATYDLGQYVNLRVEAERYQLDDADVDFISIGVGYTF